MDSIIVVVNLVVLLKSKVIWLVLNFLQLELELLIKGNQSFHPCLWLARYAWMRFFCIWTMNLSGFPKILSMYDVLMLLHHITHGKGSLNWISFAQPRAYESKTQICSMQKLIPSQRGLKSDPLSWQICFYDWFSSYMVVMCNPIQVLCHVSQLDLSSFHSLSGYALDYIYIYICAMRSNYRKLQLGGPNRKLQYCINYLHKLFPFCRLMFRWLINMVWLTFGRCFWHSNKCLQRTRNVKSVIDPLEDWLPITASRNAKWWYSTSHNVTAVVGVGVLSFPHAMHILGL